MTDINGFWAQYPSGNFRAHPVFDGSVTAQVPIELVSEAGPILVSESGPILISEIGSGTVVVGNLVRFV